MAREAKGRGATQCSVRFTHVLADYGATWQASTLAVDTTAAGDTNHPLNIVVNGQAVHVLTGPSGTMLYSGRRLP